MKTEIKLPNLPSRSKMSADAYKSMVLRNGITDHKIAALQAALDRRVVK